MIHHVHVLRADLLEVELHLLSHRRALDELPAFPVPRWRGHFADIDLRIEIGGKGLPMIAAIAVENVELADRLQLVLPEPHREHRGDARIEARTEQRHQPRLPETVVIGPLPLVFEPGLVLRLIIGGIEIVDAGCKAGIHDRQILIGQRKIDHELWPDLPDERGQCGNVFGVDGIGCHVLSGALLHACGNRIALRHGAAGKVNVREYLRVHRHLVHRDRANPTRADNQNLAHLSFSVPAIEDPSYRAARDR